MWSQGRKEPVKSSERPWNGPEEIARLSQGYLCICIPFSTLACYLIARLWIFHFLKLFYIISCCQPLNSLHNPLCFWTLVWIIFTKARDLFLSIISHFSSMLIFFLIFFVLLNNEKVRRGHQQPFWGNGFHLWSALSCLLLNSDMTDYEKELLKFWSNQDQHVLPILSFSFSSGELVVRAW